MSKERTYGFIESTYNPKDKIYECDITTIPNYYKIKDTADVFNQGNKGSCVSCATAEMYNFYCLEKHKKLDIDFEYLYNKRDNKKVDGMSPREAFEILKEENKILGYAKLNSLDTLKRSIIINGAALIALPVKSDNDDFWNGDNFVGGHAVAAVGYNEYGIIIKNSWGKEYGDLGYSVLHYDDFNKVYEAWTLLSIIV